MRKVLSLAMVLMTILCVNAQMPQFTPLPLNPNVKSGKLPNGLEYFILHNEEPKNRVNFYIAQKVGSTLETQEQLGLAHFLEHMAFNGTKNFHGKAMLNYLQDKGIRFGSDINAYTGFDETVYNVSNVPANDANLVDSCLLVLHDWSCAIELLDEEIDAERGVIQEEWRSTTDASRRMMAKVLPEIYKESQYHQMPIGSMDVVMNFPYQVLRDYYHKWYRPDQQGIVIVGDIDVVEMEKKVKELFSKIPMQKNAAKREYVSISHNDDPIFTSYRDREFPATTVRITFKEDQLPRELRSTVEGYLQGPLFEMILSTLINHRLQDFAVSPEALYSRASVYFGTFYVSSTMDSFNIYIQPKGNDTMAAVDQVMAIVARACKTGFTNSELEIVDSEIISMYEKAYNERNNTDNDAYAQEIIRYFIDGDPAPGIETEYQLVSQILPTIPVEAINQVAGMLLTPKDQVILVAQPDKDEFTMVTKEQMVGAISNAMNAEYEPMQEERITEPLIASLPKPGTVTGITEDDTLGTTVVTLSNGVKVVIKTTDFTADQILFECFREGGMRIYPESEAANVNMASTALDVSKFGPFDQKTLRKYLAGKSVSLDFTMGSYTELLNGSSTVKDLPTFMELLYTTFTNINPDQELYDITVNNSLNQMKQIQNNPRYIFQVLNSKATYGDNPMMAMSPIDILEKADYLKALDIYKNSVSNAAEYTFMFTGNVDLPTLRPLLEQYVATLPVARRKKLQTLSNVSPVSGKVNVFETSEGAEIPNVFVKDTWSGNNLDFNAANDINLTITYEILNMIYTETLREEEGGTYGAGVWGSINPNDHRWEINTYYQTNADQYKTLVERSETELMKLLNEGADADKFNRVKGNLLKQYEENIRSNNYWLGNMFYKERGFDNFTGYQQTLQNLTLEQFNAWLKNLYSGENEIEVILDAK